MAQTRPRPGKSFGPSQTPTIIAHSALYRCECEPRGGIYPLAADQCCGRRIPRGSRGEEFFGDHPPALSLSCSTALGNLVGKSRHPKDPARSCSRIMHLEAKSARNSSSAGRAWSALSREVVGGWMTLSQVE